MVNRSAAGANGRLTSDDDREAMNEHRSRKNSNRTDYRAEVMVTNNPARGIAKGSHRASVTSPDSSRHHPGQPGPRPAAVDRRDQHLTPPRDNRHKCNCHHGIAVTFIRIIRVIGSAAMFQAVCRSPVTMAALSGRRSSPPGRLCLQLILWALLGAASRFGATLREPGLSRRRKPHHHPATRPR